MLSRRHSVCAGDGRPLCVAPPKGERNTHICSSNCPFPSLRVFLGRFHESSLPPQNQLRTVRVLSVGHADRDRDPKSGCLRVLKPISQTSVRCLGLNLFRHNENPRRSSYEARKQSSEVRQCNLQLQFALSIREPTIVGHCQMSLSSVRITKIARRENTTVERFN